MRLLFAAVLSLVTVHAMAQVTNEVDTTVTDAWFNEQYFLTHSGCEFAAIHRAAKFDRTAKVFNGDFTDYGTDGKILLTGSYDQGIKTGTFKGFFPNGYLKWEGHYSHDKPDGTWYFYYADGRPLTILTVSDSITRIMDHWDVKDKQAVKQGEGKYQIEDPAYGFNEPGYRAIRYSGKIVKGLPDGTWKIDYVYDKGQETFWVEEFANGKFKGGYSPNGPGISKSSQVRFLPVLYFTNAELLLTKNCLVDEQLNFTSFMNKRQRYLIPEEIPPGAYTILIDVNSKGRPSNTRMKAPADPVLDHILLAFIGSVKYWIPSRKNDQQIDDTLSVTLNITANADGTTVFAVPVITRLNGR